MWLGGVAIRSVQVSSGTAGVFIVFTMPPATFDRQYVWLSVQVESRNTFSASQQLFMYGAAPPQPVVATSDSRWGMSIDELVLLILLMVVLVAALLSLQLLWCLSRFAGLRLERVKRCCPCLMAGRKAADGDVEGAERDDINLSLLQHGEVRFEQHQPQQPRQEGSPGATPLPPSYGYSPSQPQPASYSPALSGAFHMHPSTPLSSGERQHLVHLPPAIPGYPSQFVAPTAADGMPPGHILYPHSFVPSRDYYRYR